MGLTGRWRIQVGATLTGLLALTAVIGVQPARAFPPEQVTRGEAVWTAVCAECHGPDSTDLDAPLLLRPDSLKRFPNASAAHTYVSEKMPDNAPGSLTQEEYWDVLAFLLAQQGIGAGDTPLGPDTAEMIPTRGEGGSRRPAAKPATDPAAAPDPAAPTPNPAAKPEGEPSHEGDPPPAPEGEQGPTQ